MSLQSMWRGVDTGMREGWAHEKDMKTTVDGTERYKTDAQTKIYYDTLAMLDENGFFDMDSGDSGHRSFSLPGGGYVSASNYNWGNSSNNIG
jgi:hypothetical protein